MYLWFCGKYNKINIHNEASIFINISRPTVSEWKLRFLLRLGNFFLLNDIIRILLIPYDDFSIGIMCWNNQYIQCKRFNFCPYSSLYSIMYVHRSAVGKKLAWHETDKNTTEDIKGLEILLFQSIIWPKKKIYLT